MADTSLVFNLVARERVSGALSSMKEKFTKASAAIGIGVAGALGAGVVQAMDLSAASSKLAAQLGVGPAEAAKLSKVTAAVFRDGWGESAAVVDEAIKGVYQNIGDTSLAQGGLQGVTTKVMALATTFDQDLGGTTAAVGQMMKTGLAANADQALDILTRGFQTGADKAGDLLDTMNEYGTQFRKFGMNGQEATGLLTQGLKAGARDADLVADSIKEFSIRAIDGSKTTAQGFQAIGLNAGDMAKKIGAGGASANDALDETLTHLRAIHDPVKREAAAVNLFGTQAEDLGAALFALDPSSAVAALGAVGGAANKMSKTISETPAQALERFKRQVVGKIAEVAGSFAQFAMKNQQVMQPLVLTLGGIAATVLIVRGAMMAWAAAQAVWSAATAIATGAQWLWNSALFASPITWIIVGIIALIAAIVLIATKTTWFQTIWRVVWGAIKSAALTVWSALKTAFSATINFFISLWNTVSGALTAAWKSTWNAIKSVASAVWGAIKAVVMLHIIAVKTVVTTVMNAIRAVVSKVWGWIKTFIGVQVTAVKMAISKLSAIAGQVGAYFQHMKNVAASKVIALVTYVRGIGGRIKSAIGNLGGLLLGVGRSIIQGLINGVTGMIGSLKNRFSSITSMIPDWKGPMSVDIKLLAPSGQALMGGLMTGIDSQLPALHAQLTGVTKSVTNDVKPTVAGLAPSNMAPPPTAPARQSVRLVIDVTGGDQDMRNMIRRMVRTDGAGSVQVAFGTR
jgi:phage-related protein